MFSEMSPAQLLTEKPLSSPRIGPPVSARKASRSEPLIGVTYTAPARDRGKTHQSSSLCNVENERFDSPPPADMKDKLSQGRKSENPSAKFLAEYTKMNRARIKEHQRSLERERLWASMKRSVTNCCACCSRARR